MARIPIEPTTLGECWRSNLRGVSAGLVGITRVILQRYAIYVLSRDIEGELPRCGNMHDRRRPVGQRRIWRGAPDAAVLRGWQGRATHNVYFGSTRFVDRW